MFVSQFNILVSSVMHRRDQSVVQVVNELLQVAFNVKGCKVFVDRGYSSKLVLDLFQSKGMYFLSTMKNGTHAFKFKSSKRLKGILLDTDGPEAAYWQVSKFGNDDAMYVAYRGGSGEKSCVLLVSTVPSLLYFQWMQHLSNRQRYTESPVVFSEWFDIEDTYNHLGVHRLTKGQGHQNWRIMRLFQITGTTAYALVRMQRKALQGDARNAQWLSYVYRNMQGHNDDDDDDDATNADEKHHGGGDDEQARLETVVIDGVEHSIESIGKLKVHELTDMIMKHVPNYEKCLKLPHYKKKKGKVKLLIEHFKLEPPPIPPQDFPAEVEASDDDTIAPLIALWELKKVKFNRQQIFQRGIWNEAHVRDRVKTWFWDSLRLEVVAILELGLVCHAVDYVMAASVDGIVVARHDDKSVELLVLEIKTVMDLQGAAGKAECAVREEVYRRSGSKEKILIECTYSDAITQRIVHDISYRVQLLHNVGVLSPAVQRVCYIRADEGCTFAFGAVINFGGVGDQYRDGMVTVMKAHYSFLLANTPTQSVLNSVQTALRRSEVGFESEWIQLFHRQRTMRARAIQQQTPLPAADYVRPVICGVWNAKKP
jgi:hypothetical protein